MLKLIPVETEPITIIGPATVKYHEKITRDNYVVSSCLHIPTEIVHEWFIQLLHFACAPSVFMRTNHLKRSGEKAS
jgi:hypothetical protein